MMFDHTDPEASIGIIEIWQNAVIGDQTSSQAGVLFREYDTTEMYTTMLLPS